MTPINTRPNTNETIPTIGDHNMTNSTLTGSSTTRGNNSGILSTYYSGEIAKDWLHQKKTVDGKLIFRVYEGIFVEYDGVCYREVSRKSVCSQIESFLADKFYRYDFENENDPNAGTARPFNPTPTLINEIVKTLPAHCGIRGIAKQPAWLTEHPDNPVAWRLIPFRNGLLDFDQYLKGKIVFHKHSPDLFITSSLPYDYDPNARSKTWDYITESGLFGLSTRDKIQLLSQWMGYNLMPGLCCDTLLILTGKSEPTKTLIVDIMRAMFGYSNCLTVSLQTIAGRKGYRTLFGKSFIVVKDINAPTKRVPNIALDKIMQVVKDGPISINQDSPNLVKLPCKFTVVTNNVPMFSANKRDALDYYTRILTLNESCDEKEYTGLKQALIEDAESGRLINVALKGLVSLLQTAGGFVGLYNTELSPSVVGPRSEPLIRFVADYIVPDPACRVTTDDLYAEWVKQCESEGINAGVKPVFIRNFLNTLPDLEIHKPMIDEKRVKAITGIRLKNHKRSQYVVV